jgi:hypothetical protein
VRIFALILVSLCLFAESFDDRDFHGKWKLNRERSEFHSLLPLRPPEMLAIEQSEAELHCRIGESHEEVYSLAHKQTVNKMGNGTGKSILKWEGAALLFDTLVDGNAEQDRFTLMDRWKLVKEGQRLLIHREIVRRTGQTEGDLVYDKQ